MVALSEQIATLRAIETRYKGYRFRSRLEARWAVFFDALGIDWDYEPEGFALPDGSCYLPDFWIRSWNVWIEIKPKIEFNYWATDESSKWMTFTAAANQRLLTVIGTPGRDTCEIEIYDSWRMDAGPFTFFECPDDCPGGIGVYVSRPGGCGALFLGRHARPVGHPSHVGFWYGPRLARAYDAARGARFEHGEVGTDGRDSTALPGVPVHVLDEGDAG